MHKWMAWLCSKKTLFTKTGGRLWIWPTGSVLYTKAGQAHFPNCFSSSQCKDKLGKPLPAQYALELLTVYAWEQGSRQTEFNTAQGFRTVLELVLKYQQLCIYWTKYYNFDDPVIGQYLKRQLKKPRYSVPTWLSSPHQWTPRARHSPLEMEDVGGLHIYWSSSVANHWAGHFSATIWF